MANNNFRSGDGMISSARNSTNANVHYEKLVGSQSNNQVANNGRPHALSITANNSNTNSQVVMSTAGKLGIKKKLINN